jgi:hypothetical protein
MDGHTQWSQEIYGVALKFKKNAPLQFQKVIPIYFTPPTTPRISRLKSQVLKPTFLS